MLVLGCAEAEAAAAATDKRQCRAAVVRFLLERITAGNHGTAAEAEAEAAATDKRQCRAAVVSLYLSIYLVICTLVRTMRVQNMHV